MKTTIKEPRKTREQLIGEVAALNKQIAMLMQKDETTRYTLSELLGSYKYKKIAYYDSTNEKEVVVRDWLGIAFLIGELKADANYSILVENNKDLISENADLKRIVAMSKQEEKDNQDK